MPVHGFRFYFTPLEGVLFAFPSRYLFAIGSRLVFSLGSWSTRIRTGFLVPRPTQAPHHGVPRASRTGLSPSAGGLPMPFRCARVFSKLHGSSPCGPTTPVNWFGLLPVRSPLLRESLLISSPVLLRWFTSHGVAPGPYFIRAFGWRDRSRRVTPFGNPGVSGYVLLTPAFRSLSRPSSSYGSSRHPP